MLLSSDADKPGIADQQATNEPTSGKKYMRQCEHDVPQVGRPPQHKTSVRVIGLAPRALHIETVLVKFISQKKASRVVKDC
jgi:hypothetical protein